jgi:phage repressor protein C with HTH and peptisase S24 domain
VTLAKILRCSMDWLGGLSDADERSGGPDEPPGFKAPRRLTVPPLLDLSDQARHPGQAACVFEYELLAQISSDPSNVSRLTIHGPTMAPTLLDGDLVLVDQGKTAILQGSLYALSFGGDSLIVNRLETRPGGVLRILSDNSEITPPYEVAINQVQIIGQIIWQSRTL